MTARKLNNTNPADLLKAAIYAAYGKTIHTQTCALTPGEYAGYTAASMIPGLGDTDREVIYDAVNEAVEKALRGDPDPEDVMLFDIPDYPGSPHLALIQLKGYVPTSHWRWTTVCAHLLRMEANHHE